jgi:HEAT repeat protein
MCLAGGAMTQTDQSAADLVEQFTSNKVFWEQFKVAQKIVMLHDRSILPELEAQLSDEDRHARGNTAFIFASLGDDRGFDVIKAILDDRSDRPRGQGIPGGGWSLQGQISADRYYAAHLLGDLKDSRAVSILVPLLSDEEVNWIVPWSLGEIGDKSAILPLIRTLSDNSPDMRVLAIYALEQLDAKQALPQLRTLLDDSERIHFDGLGTVAEAAKTAIAKLQEMPQ